jgi:hypothetical protein
VTDRFVVVPASYVYLTRSAGADTEVLLCLRQNTGYRDGYWAAGIAGHVERARMRTPPRAVKQSRNSASPTST